MTKIKKLLFLILIIPLTGVLRGKSHLDRAIDAALSVRTQIAAAKNIMSGSKTFKPDVSIGINSGEMISGNIGSASLRRLDYTVIGDSVNLAQRLQSVALGGQIVITEAVYNQVKETFSCKEVGEFNLKNKSKPVKVYEVLE